MNEFYDINPEKTPSDNSFALNNLGEKRATVTYSGFRTSKSSRRSNSHSFYKTITDEDYDEAFIDKMFNLKRPYEVDQLLDHHYNYYEAKDPDKRETFLKHIQYVILRDIDKRDSKSPLMELTKEWLDAKKASLKTGLQKTENLSEPQIKEVNKIPINTKSEENGEIFMSYSWDTAEHQTKVLSFTDHLRKKGYNAQLDVMLTQGESAPNFIKMMHKAMLQHKKVIVVLSEGYKNKAESFTGGVGEEYELLLNDIKQSPRKYILVSFSGRSDAITPFGLKGREIIDLSLPGGEEKLFRKLSDENEYIFSPVGDQKPVLTPTPIAAFQSAGKISAIEIVPPTIKLGDTSIGGNLYKYIDFELTFNFRNISSTVIDGFGYDISVKQELAPEYYGQYAKDGYFNFKHTVSQKIYPNQIVSSDVIKLKAASYSKYKFIGTVITLNVYTDSITLTETYQVNDLLAVPPANEYYKDPMPLTKDIFID